MLHLSPACRSDIFKAAEEGRADVVGHMLRGGLYHLDSRDKSGQTPLHIAAAEKQEEVVRRLLKEKASVKLTDNDRQTPLHIAAEENKKEVVDQLLANNRGLWRLLAVKPWVNLKDFKRGNPQEVGTGLQGPSAPGVRS
eukprot:Skav204562  [mRNA]  locus=scaffold2682:145423:148082:+ [translate_table: standard]